MNTAAGKKTVQLLGIFLALVCADAFLVACSRRCQPPPQQPAQNLSGNPWRLVKTNNPRIQNLTRFTFLIMNFRSDFEGDVQKVVFNKQYDTPILTFKYNVSTSGKSGQLRVAYSALATDGQGAEGEQQTQTSGGEEVIDYTYSIQGGNLVLTERNTGFTYQYVPFVGIVEPDSNCTY